MKKHTLKTLLVGFSVLAIAVVLRIWDPYPIEVLRLKGLDYYQRVQEKKPSDNIAVIEIDEDSLEANGQWPWKRDVLASGINRAFEAGASAVVLPIIFAEPDRLGGDAAFVEQVGKVPVIIAQSASSKGKGEPVPRGLATIGGGAEDWLFDYPAAIGPIGDIGKSAAGVGMLLAAPELDGVVRRLPLIVQVKGEKYPTLPLEVLRVFGGEASNQAKVTEAGISAVRVAGISPIKTDANARVWLNFKYTFPSVSYASKDWSTVKGKIAVIAPTAEGLANTVATPLGTSYGYEVNLQALQMLIDEARLERPAEFDLYELGIGFLASAIAIVTICYLGYSVAGLIFAVLMVAPMWAGFHLFSNYGFLADFTWICGTLVVAWGSALFMRFVMEFKLKQQIKKQFETYLSPDQVAQLQKNPDALKLGGEERELSIMFTDVRGFTAISEHYGKNVQGLTQIMNRYMTAMTRSIIEKKGTLDKYIGDAQMAFWNAPLDDASHAIHAVETGLEMMGSLKAFNEEIAKEGVPAFGMGLGINTGVVVVGNMGSEQRFDYTCLGDHVNLASRLEGQSKPYGVKIVLGPLTRERVKDVFPTLELDCIAVKGKKEGVKIYTVFDKGTKIYSESHEQFLQLYRGQKWNEAIRLAKDLSSHMDFMSGYYKMMIERIEYLKDNDPGANWDGVYRATSK
jgi:adenylate cyclase